MEPLERIEAKLNAIDAKLDNHLERIAKAESSIIWLKWVFSVILSLTGFSSISKLIGK